MTKEYREYAKSRIEYLLKISRLDERDKEALEAAIQALSQEPCELLIIKSDILLHQDDRKKWVESIKREKESGVIILPPYFEPLLVPTDIEINIEQKPGKWIDRQFQSKIDGEIRNGWECSECGERFFRYDLVNTDEFIPKYCPNCGAKMVEPQESEEQE